MKLTTLLLTSALLAPAALAFGVGAAFVSASATGIALCAIVIGDYSRKTCTYQTVLAERSERHPLAA